MASRKKLCARLDDLTVPDNKNGFFSFGRPRNAKVDQLVMKPPKVLPCPVEISSQDRESTCDDKLVMKHPKVLTCPVEILPSDRDSTCDDKLVKKRPKLLPGPVEILYQDRESTCDDKLVVKCPKMLPCSVEILFPDKELTCDEEFDEDIEKELLEYLSMLQSLEKKEEELKINILYEKLKKEEHISDQSLTPENIDRFQQKLDQAKQNLRMKQVYNSKRQLSEILQKIMQPHIMKNKGNVEDFEYGDEARIFFQNLMLEKKQKEKEVNLLQKQIKEAEENYLQLRTNIDDILSTPTKNKEVILTEEELNNLKEENSERSSRIQLLSNIAISLIDNISIQGNVKDDLKLLALCCENILDWNSEGLEELKELCKKVYSTKI